MLWFRVQQFRSINDSGVIRLAFSKSEKGEDRSLTALVGRNESGKSNLLLALQTLNPPGGAKPLAMIKDFPRHRHKREWDESFQFVSTCWELDEERTSLSTLSQAFAGVTAWLARHPRWTFHFTPTSCSWLNAVETFFATLTKRTLKRGAFRSVVDLQATINRYLAEANRDPKPFVWTADPDKIIAAVHRRRQTFKSIH